MIKSISPEIQYIGVDDVDLDLFESQYVVPEGMAYNSYVILDEKVAVMDTVDARKGAEWLANLEQALNGRKPDYLVVHHMEPDHSGSILEITRKYPDIRIVATAKALVFLGQFFDGETFNTLAVQEGDTLELGAHTLRFIMAPMVHWPEVMVSFDSKDKVLARTRSFSRPMRSASSAPCPSAAISGKRMTTGPARPAAITSISAASTALPCRCS